MQYQQPPLDPIPIDKLINETGSLARICKKSKQLQLANDMLSQMLPLPMRECCYITNIDIGLVTLCTKNAAWATQLRYQQDTLLKALRQHTDLRHLNQIRIRIRLPEQPLSTKIPCRTLQMSSHTSQLLQQTAMNIQHPLLQQALLRLAKNGETSS